MGKGYGLRKPPVCKLGISGHKLFRQDKRWRNCHHTITKQTKRQEASESLPTSHRHQALRPFHSHWEGHETQTNHWPEESQLAIPNWNWTERLDQEIPNVRCIPWDTLLQPPPQFVRIWCNIYICVISKTIFSTENCVDHYSDFGGHWCPMKLNPEVLYSIGRYSTLES